MNSTPERAPKESDLEQDTAKGKALLSAGAEIIAKVLSTDSNAFLQASRQSGGQ